MILGNSRGNNTGKKYFLRVYKSKTKPTPENQQAAKEFTNWYGENYQSILTELIQKHIYDDDMVGETFFRIYDKILYSGLRILENRAYFMRAYYTNLIQESIDQKRYSTFSPYFDDIDTEPYNPDLDLERQRLELDIFTYVYRHYRTQEFELFKMYMSLKPAINYETLSEITNLKRHRIQSIISRIKKDVCSNREFIIRRRNLVA